MTLTWRGTARQRTTMELDHFRKHQLKALQHQVCEELRRRYARNRPPLYGQLNKGFTPEELKIFLAHVNKQVPRRVFELMAGLGLSISEACKLRVSDLDLGNSRLWVRSAKGRHPTMFYLPSRIKELLHDQLAAVPLGQEYIFPRCVTSNPRPYASPDAMRSEFRRAIVASGLDFTYANSTESYHGRKLRQLHRLTTHSLRHYFITRVHNKSKDLILTQRLARHKNVRNTQRYIFTDQEELDRLLVFASED